MQIRKNDKYCVSWHGADQLSYQWNAYVRYDADVHGYSNIWSQAPTDIRRQNGVANWTSIATWRWQRTWKGCQLKNGLLLPELEGSTYMAIKSVPSTYSPPPIHPPSYSVSSINTSEHYPPTSFPVFKLSVYQEDQHQNSVRTPTLHHLTCTYNPSYCC
jgi:hypothetical protein